VPADIGSLVVVPSGSRSASFAVQIVTAVDPVVQPSDCVAPMYQGCIVARRQLSFIPHTPLTLPIEMTLDCLNVFCSSAQTCYHGQCVTAQAACTASVNVCTPDLSGPDASSPGDDDAAEEAGHDATTETPDAPADAPQADGPSTVPPDEASTMDAPATDGPPDVGLQDAPIADAPGEAEEDAAPEASIRDAAPDVAASESDASEASTPVFDGGPLGDGSILGSCLLDAGQSSGVECSGSRCVSGDVCCVSFNPGVMTSAACTTLASCDYNGTAATTYSALGCKSVGDCATGKECCASASKTGNGYVTQCLTSCPDVPLQETTACQNSCECPGAMPQCNPATCLGFTIGYCGGTGGSSCF
jgi:hypothetical protein